MNRKQWAIASLFTITLLFVCCPDIRANLINEGIIHLAEWAILTLIIRS